MMTLAETLAAAETAAPVESLDVVARMLKEHLGAASVSFLITDFTGGSVVRLGAAGSVDTDEPARRITLRGTLYDDVIRTQRPSVEDKGDGALVRVVAPVTNRGDAIGLLELFLPATPDAETMREVGETAHALAYIVIANRSFTDVYQWGRRTKPLSPAAEIQHWLLPASLAREAGFDAPHSYRVQSLDLRPGDRLVILTDGGRPRQAPAHAAAVARPRPGTAASGSAGPSGT